MAEEIEVKILNIDKVKLEQKLIEIGAKKIADTFFRSTSFDYPGFPLDKEAAWLRLRNDGVKTTLAYKKRLGVTGVKGDNDSGMEEVEIEVSDYEATKEILKKLGIIEKFAQEKKRVTWQKDDVTFDIDTWPRLNTYLEIESDNWDKIDTAIIELGYDLKDKVICSATQVYEQNGINDKDYCKLCFDEWIRRDGTVQS